MQRLLEIAPGVLSWGTLIALFFFSWKLPLAVAIFIVLYDFLWLLRTIYFFLHLRFSFVRMKKNLTINWRDVLEHSSLSWRNVYHMAVFTIYKEPYEVVRESVKSLSETNFPLSQIILVLAIEERGGEVDRKNVDAIAKEFGSQFKAVHITVHPANIKGEVAGKASNEAWAVHNTYKEVIIPNTISPAEVLVSVFDADVHPTKDYFGILTHTFATTPNPTRAGYQPIVIFSNAYQVPLFARLLGFSCSFWSMIQQARPEQLMTFSCYSIPLQALVDVQFWNTNVIAEDARIFYQCLNQYAGDWRVIPLYYPVTMEAVSGSSFMGAATNLYKQQRRWAWGVENVPYVVSEFVKNKSFPWRTKLFWILNIFDTFHSWAVSSLVIFLAGILPNIVGGVMFRTTVASYNLPVITSTIMNLSALGLVSSAFMSILLLSPKIEFAHARWYHSFYYILQWMFIPIAFILFGALPALDAQTRLMLGGRWRLGYWNTPRSVAK